VSRDAKAELAGQAQFGKPLVILRTSIAGLEESKGNERSAESGGSGNQLKDDSDVGPRGSVWL
jgi:hypothetical protein